MNRDALIKYIKAVGQDLCKCESIIPQDCNLMKSFNIWVNIDQNGLPDIQYEANYIPSTLVEEQIKQ